MIREIQVWKFAPILMLASCSAFAQTRNIEAMGWLAGSWVLEESGVRIEEHWIPESGGTMLGVSRTVKGGKTVAFEFLRLEARGDGVVYVAHPNARPGTDFTLTKLEVHSAVFENPAHDFPKIIRYRLNPDGTLLAQIEGDEEGRHVTQDFLYHSMARP